MDIGFLIDGRECGATGGATYDRNDPYTGKLATRAAAANVADANAAADAAAAAFKTWSKTGPGERRALLLKAADVMASKVGEFTELMIEETGSTAPWAGFNVMLAANMLREVGAMTTQISGEIDNVSPAMRVYSEEAFGPVKPIVRVDGEEEAIRVANDTEYGLSSAVFSRDVQRALAVAARLEAGICHINGATVNDEAQMPFGGMKGSGYGRFGGKAAINEFTDLRWVTVEDPNQHYPF